MTKQRCIQVLSGVFLLFFLGACTPDSFPEDIPTVSEEPEVTTTASEFDQAFIDAVNTYRQNGCTCGSQAMPPVAALNWDALLTIAAQRHANDMLDNDFFSHTGSDGSSSSGRVTDAGYNWLSVGENIAFGYTGIETVVDAWIDSEDHCRNIMNASFTEMGAAQKGKYWVQTFGRPR